MGRREIDTGNLKTRSDVAVVSAANSKCLPGLAIGQNLAGRAGGGGDGDKGNNILWQAVVGKTNNKGDSGVGGGGGGIQSGAGGDFGEVSAGVLQLLPPGVRFGAAHAGNGPWPARPGLAAQRHFALQTASLFAGKPKGVRRCRVATGQSFLAPALSDPKYTLCRQKTGKTGWFSLRQG